MLWGYMRMSKSIDNGWISQIKMNEWRLKPYMEDGDLFEIAKRILCSAVYHCVPRNCQCAR